MDPFSQHNAASLSPSTFFNELDLAPQHIQPGPRNYKSRKYRPCDFCRARQVACKIETSPPCSLCQTHKKECTFVERPKKKRRPNSLAVESNGGGVPHPDHQTHDFSLPTNTPQWSPNFLNQLDDRIDERVLADGTYQSWSIAPQQMSPSQIPTQHASPSSSRSGPQMSGEVRNRPLDAQGPRSARLIGETGESNPYLLRHYRYDENDECTISKITYRRIKKSQNANDIQPHNRNEPPVVFMLADDSLCQKGEPRVEEDVLANARREVYSMFTEEEALRLIGLFFRFVYPYFPIMCRAEMLPSGHPPASIIHTLPLSLLASIYASALPFMLYDDLLATTIVHSPPSAHHLFRISWLAVTNELHCPRLATLQACLLLLQRAPTNRYTTDTPWKFSLIGWTVSLAQTLGLTRECGDWLSLPAWEITLRKRLWFGVYIMDKWGSLGAGMASHIKNEDFNVTALVASDLELFDGSQSYYGFPDSAESNSHFRLLTELTMILSDIMDAYFSLRATERTSKNFALSLELAKPLRTRLKLWNDSLPPGLSLHQNDHVDSRGMAKLSANASLSLAYIVATMTLFRALLRPIEKLTNVEEEDHGIVEGRLAVRAGAKECAKEVVELAENLGRGALDAFWHSWSRANFAIASSFLMHLMLTADSPESHEINELVTRWRWAMRVGSGHSGNGLMSLGLLRLDGLLLENNGTSANNNNSSSSSQQQVIIEDGQVHHQRLGSTSLGVGVGIMS